ncbi:MAG: hypothetical protein R6V12_12840, partial [Candidatus Hydrogenedentota bacterium]
MMKKHAWRRYLTAGIVLTIGFAFSAEAMTEAELQSLYLGVLEHAVECFEPLWTDNSDTIPNSGFFDIRGYQNWKDAEYVASVTIPCNGMLILCYSVLLNETDKETFSSLNVPREVLREHAVKATRWLCLTSGYVEDPYIYPVEGLEDAHLGGPSWTREHGRRIDAMGWFTVGTTNLWPEYDDETRDLIRQVFVGSAAKEVYKRGWRYGGGGEHDTVKQDMASTIGAAFMFPNLPETAPCWEVLAQQGKDIVSTEHDFACSIEAAGKPVSEWAHNWNLYPDYSSDHHGWAQVWYGCDLIFEGRTYAQLMQALTGRAMPETFTYSGNGFDGVLEWVKAISLPEAEPTSVHGMEYDAYYGAGLLAYCYGAVIKKDPVAAALEERAARLLSDQIRAVGMYDYHRNSWAKAAAAYLMHKHAGPRAKPVPFRKAWARLEGVYHHRWQQNLVHRMPRKLVSFSWDSLSNPVHGPQGYIVPAVPEDETLDPFIYLMPMALAGDVDVLGPDGKGVKRRTEATYTWDVHEQGFATCGRVRDDWLDRYCAFFSFQSGPDVFIEAMQVRKDCGFSWAGVPVALYHREGRTPERHYVDAQGPMSFGETNEHVSNWWSVDDRIGLAIANGNGRAKIERRPGFNWARLPEYRDKMDCIFASPIRRIDVKAGDFAADVAVAMYVHAGEDAIAQAAGALEQNMIETPEGWRGYLVTNAGESLPKYLAVANFYGEKTAELALETPLGCPIFAASTSVRGTCGLASVCLAPHEALGSATGLFISTEDGGGALCRQLNPYTYCLRACDGEEVTARVVYAGAASAKLEIEGAAELSEATDASGVPSGARANNITFTGTVTLRWQPAGKALDADLSGPFVDLTELEVRRDGRVRVRVEAS